tara:strand:- start:326 stop:682 length:357 start_codon:yes stop_codon:yes gene_type:complete
VAGASNMNTQELYKDAEFAHNKENIRCRLVGTSKYYNAHQCHIFGENVRRNGWGQYTADQIDYVYFTKHSVTIKLMSTAETDCGRFTTANEMFAWVAGYNRCMFEIDREGTPTTIITY